MATKISSHRVGWVASPDLPYGRGTYASDILSSCLFTIFVATWTVQHLSVPPQAWSKRRRLLRKLHWMGVALLAPELIAALAVADYFNARESLRKMRSAGLSGWTLQHAFFADMGGFVAQQSTDGSETFLPINTQRLIQRCDDVSVSDLLQISKEEIEDRSKSDPLLKCIACLQALWLATEVISRLFQQLVITELELATLAYIACLFTSLGFWMFKPTDVNVPIILQMPDRPGDPKSRPQACESFNNDTNLYRLLGVPAPNVIRDGIPPTLNLNNKCVIFATPLIAAIFAAIHIAGWNLDFPSATDRYLWRLCSSACGLASTYTAICWFSVCFSGGQWLHSCFRARWTKEGTAQPVTIMRCLTTIYIVARLGLLAGMFGSLRSQPESAYATVDWCRFIPHFH